MLHFWKTAHPMTTGLLQTVPITHSTNQSLKRHNLVTYSGQLKTEYADIQKVAIYYHNCTSKCTKGKLCFHTNIEWYLPRPRLVTYLNKNMHVTIWFDLMHACFEHMTQKMQISGCPWSCFHTSLPLVALPLCFVNAACSFIVSNEQPCRYGLITEQRRSRVAANSTVCDLPLRAKRQNYWFIAKRCLLLDQSWVANGVCTVVQISPSKRQSSKCQASLKAA